MQISNQFHFSFGRWIRLWKSFLLFACSPKISSVYGSCVLFHCISGMRSAMWACVHCSIGGSNHMEYRENCMLNTENVFTLHIYQNKVGKKNKKNKKRKRHTFYCMKSKSVWWRNVGFCADRVCHGQSHPESEP